MKVLMQIRRNAFELEGGDTIQMLRTKQALERLGVMIDVSTELHPDVSAYDVVHLFNLTRVQETYFQALNAKKAGKPIVLSTIYWPFEEYESTATLGLRGFFGRHLSIDGMERLKAAGKYALRGERDMGTRYLMTSSYTQMQRSILESTDVFLPNAKTEMDKIEEHLNFCSDDYVVVPNAVDVDSIREARELPSEEYAGYEDYLICVGRIDARKNQLNLVRAIEGTGYKLLLVGKESPGHKRYFRQVMAEAKRNSNIEYVERIDNSELYKVYARCPVSVLPSWFETPGLASLEAAAMGCRIIVSPKGTTRDYFGDDAFYCDVSDPLSIRSCIDNAYRAEPKAVFAERIMTECTWDKAAERTFEGYRKALARRGTEESF